MSYQLYTLDAPPVAEDPRAQARRRLQQRRCLVCGSRDLSGGHKTSYFCALHIRTHRYCSTCETLRTAEDHGRDSRCRSCSSARALAQYRADPERTLYRLRLKQLARRRQSRVDEIFEAMRRRIALAAFVAATPGWSWPRRARLLGVNANHIAEMYRKQCAGRIRDADAAERERR